MEGVSRRNPGNRNYPVNIGYITIPNGVDRSSFIKTCYRKERVAVQLDDGGGVIQNCYVSKGIMQDLIFPEKFNQLGSCVCFMCPKHYNIPIIVGVISKADETQLLEEGSFKNLAFNKFCKVSIEGKASSGELFINIDSEYSGIGGVHINLRNKDNSSKFNVNCFGSINLTSEGDTSVKALGNITLRKVSIDNGKEKDLSSISLTEEGFEFIDDHGNYLKSDSRGIIDVIAKERINLFEGSQPIPLGTELKAQLEVMKGRIDSIIKVLKDSQTASATAASYATAIKTGVEAITEEEDFEKINSTKSFTD